MASSASSRIFARGRWRKKDDLRLEEVYALYGGQKPRFELQTEITHRLVEEAGVARFIAAMSQSIRQPGFFLFDGAAEVPFVEQEPENSDGAALLQELHTTLAGCGIELVAATIEIRVAKRNVSGGFL